MQILDWTSGRGDTVVTGFTVGESESNNVPDT